MLLIALYGSADATPYVPDHGDQVLAEIPESAHYSQSTARALAGARIDVALRLGQLYIGQARSSGDLRFLGYAESVLQPWLRGDRISAAALVLHATVLQSRHEFSAALAFIDQALQLKPDDPQAWLTRATILRVLGRYDESLASCTELRRTNPAVTELCVQSLRGLTGDLPAAYTRLTNLSSQSMPAFERAWRDSELGEMATRLGKDDEAEHWFQNGLSTAPQDFYIRAAYADLLLRQGRTVEVLSLLKGLESIEPLLLRIAIAQKQLGDSGLAVSRARLAAAFSAESQRGEGVHRREEARFLLDVKTQPQLALQAAKDNWRVQREVDDVLILIRAAQAAHSIADAEPAFKFVRMHGLQDARLPTDVTP